MCSHHSGQQQGKAVEVVSLGVSTGWMFYNVFISDILSRTECTFSKAPSCVVWSTLLWVEMP